MSVVTKLLSFFLATFFSVFKAASRTVLIWIIFHQEKKMALSGQAESKLTLKCA